MTDVSVALVLVSHSDQLALGLAKVAGQMAPQVSILPAGGTDDGRIGTSFARVEQAIQTLIEQGYTPVVLSDMGSAGMLAEAVIETLDASVYHVHAPFVEGAVAAAVAAQTGGDGPTVIEAARNALTEFIQAPTQAPQPPHDTADGATHTVKLKNKLGLHARPAAMVARIASEYDAQVTVNGVDATSVLALMGLALPGGAEVQLNATGAQATDVIKALVPQFEEGFGEE